MTGEQTFLPPLPQNQWRFQKFVNRGCYRGGSINSYCACTRGQELTLKYFWSDIFLVRLGPLDYAAGPQHAETRPQACAVSPRTIARAHACAVLAQS